MKDKYKFKVGDQVVLITDANIKGVVESVGLSIANEGLVHSYDIKIGEKLYINTIESNLKIIKKY